MRVPALLILLACSTALSAEVYQWRDANGRIVFGDSPPEAAAAKEVELQPLTIADSYKSADKDGEQQADVSEAKEEDEATSPKVEYKQFAVKSPRKDDAIRANNGNLLVRFAIEPALQKGHGIAVYLDGKQVANDAATVFSLKNVSRGKHSLFAVLHDENDEVLENTQPVSFNVLRASRI